MNRNSGRKYKLRQQIGSRYKGRRKGRSDNNTGTNYSRNLPRFVEGAARAGHGAAVRAVLCPRVTATATATASLGLLLPLSHNSRTASPLCSALSLTNERSSCSINRDKTKPRDGFSRFDLLRPLGCKQSQIRRRARPRWSRESRAGPRWLWFRLFRRRRRRRPRLPRSAFADRLRPQTPS